MTTAGGLVVRWSVRPAVEKEQSTWTLLGSGGKAVLHMPVGEPWRLEGNLGSGDSPRSEAATAFNAAAHVLDELILAIRSGRDNGRWMLAARSLDVVDSAEHSLARGRAIELFERTPSEESTFKGIMSAVGCGLLLACLLLFVVIGLVGDAVGAPIWRFWHIILLGILAVFLLLQFLPAIVLGGGGKKPPEKQE
jgi:hypothetical protein